MSTYKGFSFFQYEYNKSIIQTDVRLVETDLYNHIFTRRGSRVKMPSFGTSIPDMLFEPLDEELLQQIQTEIEAVFAYDPRVTQNSIAIYPFYDTHSVYVVADLYYVELDTTVRFDLNLEFQG